MNSVYLENSYIESVIAGLKNLYEELVLDEKEKEIVQGETRVTWFENSRSKAIESLKELFIKE
jgi:ASC-1-like (ASCH) protein